MAEGSEFFGKAKHGRASAVKCVRSAAARRAVGALGDVRIVRKAAAATAAVHADQRIRLVAGERKIGDFAVAARGCRRGVRRGDAALADVDFVGRVRRHGVRLAVEEAAAAAAAANLVAARAAAANHHDLHVRHVVRRREAIRARPIAVNELVIKTDELAFDVCHVDIAGRAEGADMLAVLLLVPVHHVDGADAEVVRHVLLQARHGDREASPRRHVVNQRRPSRRLRFAVHPQLVFDAALGGVQAAIRNGARELHVGVAHVNNRVGQSVAALPHHDRDGGLHAMVNLRPLRDERRILLSRGKVFRLDPVWRTHALRVAHLVDKAVVRASADLLSADDEVFVCGGSW